MSQMINIVYVNNDGGGFAEPRQVLPGTNLSTFFSTVLPGRDPSKFLIRVNRLAQSGTYVLQENDRVTIVPTKIEGARI